MSNLFVCTSADMDRRLSAEEEYREAEATFETIRKRSGVRSHILASYEWVVLMSQHEIKESRLLGNAPPAFFYGCLHPTRSRRTPVNVDDMVDKWAKVIPRMILAHDKDEVDAAEAKVDELLTPMLAAPVKQLREFFSRLVERLKSDPTVPLIVWRTFDFWHDKVIKPAEDEAIKRLKRDLAEEVVNLVDPRVDDSSADVARPGTTGRSERGHRGRHSERRAAAREGARVLLVSNNNEDADGVPL